MDCGSPLPLSIPPGRASRNSTLTRGQRVVPKRQRTAHSKPWRSPLRPNSSRSVMDCGSPPTAFPSRRDAHRETPHLTRGQRVVPKRQRTGALQNPGGLPRPNFSRSVVDCGSPLPPSLPPGRAPRNSSPHPRTTRRSKAPEDGRTPNPGGLPRPNFSRSVMDCGSPSTAFSSRRDAHRELHSPSRTTRRSKTAAPDDTPP